MFDNSLSQVGFFFFTRITTTFLCVIFVVEKDQKERKKSSLYSFSLAGKEVDTEKKKKPGSVS